MDLFPFLVPGKRENQRLELALNGSAIGAWQLTQSGTLHVTLPASAWNAEPEALLVFRFPDAVSPASLGMSADPRPFAFGFRKLVFRVD
jgi:hypothetical protein